MTNVKAKVKEVSASSAVSSATSRLTAAGVKTRAKVIAKVVDVLHMASTPMARATERAVTEVTKTKALEAKEVTCHSQIGKATSVGRRAI